ncbi:unnamed protein product [Durusdinium trenchii]|uniref:Uncharacterized protein n=1 Tax=Durusdinium trenchii TaxID=1381693 RepID=A0ABP0HFI1_9DINO
MKALSVVPLMGLQSSRIFGLSDMVALQVDLPPDVQRMFEEMCELEGVSQTEMLTRWIDARWEAMGYKDSDLEREEVAQDTASESEADSCKGEACLEKGQDKPHLESTASQDATEEDEEESEENEEDAMPDIDTWMQRYGSEDLR